MQRICDVPWSELYHKKTLSNEFKRDIVKRGEYKVHLKESKLAHIIFLSHSPAPLPAVLNCCQGNPIRNVSTWLTNDSLHAAAACFLCRIELLYGWMEGGIMWEAITSYPYAHTYTHTACPHIHMFRHFETDACTQSGIQRDPRKLANVPYS